MAKKKDGTIEIRLTPQQQEALFPLLEKAKKAYDKDRPVMILGQVTSDLQTARFGVIDHDKSMAIWVIMEPKRADTKKTGKALAEV